MGRKRTGSLLFDEVTKRWVVRLTLDGDIRKRIELPEGMSHSEAIRRKARYAEMAARGELVFDEPKLEGETVATFFDRWLASRAAKPVARIDRSMIKTHVLPIIGTRTMASITSEDARAIVERLDDAIEADKMAWPTARNVWGSTRKMFSDAFAAKRSDLRILPSNPCLGVRGPERGDEKLRAYLYPSEFLSLLSCTDVPIEARWWVALQTLISLRPGELEALECGDIEGSAVRIHRAVEWASGDLKGTKTGRVRAVPIDPTLRPLLDEIIARRGGRGRLFPTVPFATKPSADLRGYLASGAAFMTPEANPWSQAAAVDEARTKAGRSVVARVRLTGSGPAHTLLARANAVAGICDVARDTLGEGSPFAFIESVHDATRPEFNRAERAAADDFVGSVLRFTDELRAKVAAGPEEDVATVDQALDALIRELWASNRGAPYLRNRRLSKADVLDV
ncbi:MAG: site-specific integrase, partial [Deltaproteobacteria bacterium]